MTGQRIELDLTDVALVGRHEDPAQVPDRG